MRLSFNQRHVQRRGAVAVEFAITLPILLTFFGFFWEFARAEQIRQTAATAAYEGARQAIVEGGSANDARLAAQAILDAVRVQGTGIVVTPNTITRETPSVQVTITVPLASNTWVIPHFMNNLNVMADVTLNRN